MARREDDRSKTLEEAVAQLKRDPSHPVHALVDDLEVELRVVSAVAANDVDDMLSGAGPWQGESSDELIRRIKAAREDDEAGSRRP